VRITGELLTNALSAACQQSIFFSSVRISSSGVTQELLAIFSPHHGEAKINI